MPEARGWLVGAGELEGGIWMRRGPSPVRPRPGAWLAQLEAANKENIPPRRSRRCRKSPLPVWYPRTPLRDITAIVHALERRRMRIQAAAAQQRNADAEYSPQFSVLATPMPQATGDTDQTPSSEGRPSDTLGSATNPTAVGTSTPSLTEDCLLSFSAPVSQTEQQLQNSSSTDATSSPAEQTCLVTPDRPAPAYDEEKLSNSIDEIERVVRNNLKRTKEEPSQKVAQRKTLMSMR